jgi:hypothetical protein
LAGTDLVGEAEGFQLAKTTDLLGVIDVGLFARPWREVDNAGAGAVARELPVEVGPTRLI